MEEFLELFKEYEKRSEREYMAIEICSDGSGILRDIGDNDIFEFYSIKELKEKLTKL
jgi:hypothetical protein